MDFGGRNVIVTGGASGIGKAICEECAGLGATVLIADINLEAAQQVCEELGNGARAYRVDMSDSAGIEAVAKQMTADVGRIHVLINCAGICSTMSFEELTQAEWDRTIAINLSGVFTMSHALFTHMKEMGGGRIVNIASIAGKVGGGLLGTSAYAASKAGVIGLTKAIAREGVPFGIACNAVCPSLTRTPMTERMPKEQWDRIVSTIPMGRAAEPAEIAHTVCFLASEDAAYITGETAVVDGGVCRHG